MEHGSGVSASHLGRRSGANNLTVLVTGGSGFVAGWAIVTLLERGYRVRTTIRSLARESDVRAMIEKQGGAGPLSFFAANLLDDDGWDEATDGSDFVLHVASPIPVGEFRGQDVITPARQGTMRVLAAAQRAGVKRVVITSSTAAATPRRDKSGSNVAVADESVWTDLPPKAIHNYPRSKTLAERDAWAFVARHSGMELATVLPASIQGPVLGSDYAPSVKILAMMLRGTLIGLPRLGWGIVDVRDLVELHIAAMLSPVAAGERFIASGEFLWLHDIATILRDELGAKASKVPVRTLPSALLRAAALFNTEARILVPDLGVRQLHSSAKAERLLGWTPRSARSSILDTAHSLVDNNLL